MGIFEKLKTVRDFERRRLPLLDTLEDFDIVQEIGFHQDAGMPLSLMRLFRLGVGSAPTVQRRLKRLKALGLVVQRPCVEDGRAIQLSLSTGLRRIYREYERLLAAT
jgi:hypothetical protein